MFSIFKQWLFWWKKSRKTKKFFKEELMLARHKGPHEFDEKIRQAVIKDWEKAGYDITVPNFGGGTMETGI